METNADSSTNNDLLNRLTAATENKTPGNNGAVLKSDFWDKSETETETETEQEPVKKTPDPEQESKETKTTTTASTTTAATPEPPKKISKDVKEASARTAVGMLDFTQKILFTPILNYKFKKKFTPQEIERLDDGVEDANKSDLDAADMRIRTKWDRLLKKHLKKVDAIPLDDSEKNDLEKAFYNYMDVKEKHLPPEYFLGLTVITVLGKRAIDAFTD